MKITVIFTGGTIACSNKNGALSPDGANSFTLIEMYRAEDDSVEFAAGSPYFILSENLGAEHWDKLCGCIRGVALAVEEKFTGFFPVERFLLV